MSQQEEWVSLSDASFRLKTEGYDVSVSKLSRMARQGQVKTEDDPLDNRVKLVELGHLRQIFASSRRSR